MEHYLEHFKGDEVFCRQIMDIKERVEENYMMQVTPFLNPHQQMIVSSLIGKHQELLFIQMYLKSQMKIMKWRF